MLCEEIPINGICFSVSVCIPCINLEKIFCMIKFSFNLFSTLVLIQLEATALLNTESFGKIGQNLRIKEVSMKPRKRDLQTNKQKNKTTEEREKHSVKVREKERSVGKDTASNKPSFLG